jgi:hypothetical protein
MKVYEVEGGGTAQTIEEALELAAETGVLQVPEQVLSLNVRGGRVKEVADE